jgi:hypothetical protein
MNAYDPPTMHAMVAPWLRATFMQDAAPKLAAGTLMAIMANAGQDIAIPLAFALVAWGCDFAGGIVRALADPTMKINTERAWVGIAKGVMIPCALVFASAVEAASIYFGHVDPGGKIIAVVTLAIVWEEFTSFQRHARFFWRNFRVNLGGLGIFKGKPDPDGGGGSRDVQAFVTEKEAERLKHLDHVGEQLAGMEKRERDDAGNGRAGTGAA